MRFRSMLVFGLVLMVTAGTRADEIPEALRVLPVRDPSRRAPSELYQKLHEWAEEAIVRRSAAYERLKTPDDVRAWQKERRSLFLKALGEFPPRTALNAKTVRTLQGDGFTVENVIFESRPRHHITANLYLPATKPPFPAVIVPCGHSYTGKAADGYQRVSMLLARNGIAALCYDPIGQGERYQTFGSDGRPLGEDYTGSPSSVKQLQEVAGLPHFNPVEEHTLIGLGSILVGTNTAQYRIYDGMRAIDYLVSRPEIDAARIGCTGNSGGGTLTAYLMALDERIACAAPTCYLTTFRRLLATAGPQDAEQNLFGQLRDGLDEADYVLMRAPLPTVLCAGTRDATFDVTGTWDIFREAKRVYARLGHSEQVDLVEADEPHGFTKPLRVGAVRWMRRWLLKTDGAITEPELPVFALIDLQCTPSGQVMHLPQEVSVFQINQDKAEELAGPRDALWKVESLSAARQRVRELAGIRPLSELSSPEWRVISTVGGGAKSEPPSPDRILIETETGLTLPALVFVPAQPDGRRVLYLHSQGKHVDAMPGGAVMKLVQSGALVLAVDLSGLGETAQKHPRDWGGELFGPGTQEFFVAYLLGRSLVGIRAEEILTAARVLATYSRSGRSTGESTRVEVLATGSAVGIPALHAVALEPALFSKIAVRESLTSWQQLLTKPAHGLELTNTVHAALTAYDLPDLLNAIRFAQVSVHVDPVVD